MPLRRGSTFFKLWLICMGAVFAGASFANVPDTLYSAATNNGGPGIAGCTGAKNCTLQIWGVDLNADTGFAWHVKGGTGGKANIFVRIAVPGVGSRAMSMTVNGVKAATIKANFTGSPRPTGTEMGPFAANLNAGDNIIQLLDSESTAEFDVHSLRVQDASWNGSIVEAEKYDRESPIAPFVIQAGAGGLEYITATLGNLTAPAAASNTAQAYYTLKATGTTMSIYATVNLPTDNSDSFYYQVGGLSAWATKNGPSTKGFQEIPLITVSNAVIGKTYIFKIQRREAGAQLDKFRLVGGIFTNGTAPANTASPELDDTGEPTLISDIHFADQYLAECVRKTGKTLIADLTELSCGPADNINDLDGKVVMVDLTGLERLKFLTRLDLMFVSAPAIDFSVFKALTSLSLARSYQYTALDLSANSALTSLELVGTQIKTLDLSANRALTNLRLVGGSDSQSLTQLTLPASDVLTSLTLGYTQITEFNFSAYPALTQLELRSNQNLSLVDLNGNLAIEKLVAEDNLGALKLPEAPSLRSVELGMSSYVRFDGDVDLSLAKGLTHLSLRNFVRIPNLSYLSELTSLEVIYSGMSSFDITSNTKLDTLRLDGVNMTAIDLSANTELRTLEINGTAEGPNLPTLDLTANRALTDLSLFGYDGSALSLANNPALTTLSVGGANKLTSLNLASNLALSKLALGSNNNLTSLDLSSNANLKAIDINGQWQWQTNQYLGLAQLILPSSSTLKDIRLSSLPLSALDISRVPELEVLNVWGSKLAAINLTANLALKDLTLSFSPIAVLELSANKALESIGIYELAINAIDLSENTQLKSVVLQTSLNSVNLGNLKLLDNIEMAYPLNKLDISSNTALTTLTLWNATSLDLSANTALKSLKLYFPGMTSLNLSANRALADLELYEGLLSSLDLSANKALTRLSLTGGQLTNLDISSNPTLSDLQLTNVPITSLNFSANKALSDLMLYNIRLTDLNLSATSIKRLFLYSTPLPCSVINKIKSQIPSERPGIDFTSDTECIPNI